MGKINDKLDNDSMLGTPKGELLAQTAVGRKEFLRYKGRVFKLITAVVMILVGLFII